MDDPNAVDRLDSVATDFAATGLAAVTQTDGMQVDLVNWLEKYWF
jgi:hypothetical protein